MNGNEILRLFTLYSKKSVEEVQFGADSTCCIMVHLLTIMRTPESLQYVIIKLQLVSQS